MRRQHWTGLALLALFATVLGTALAQAPEQRGPEIINQQAAKQRGPETFKQRVARHAKLSEEDTDRFLRAIGRAITEELSSGQTVNLEGLGTFRVVRVPEHKDLRLGRPTVISAVNTVEFLPSGELSTAANSEKAVPAETVPEFRFIPLPGQTPGQKQPRERTPPVRIR